ncbi:hypothetical protein [Streptomyces sp. MZ04]|uniref:hypothetical protein n=1 Tax=Streptomyces sp. MZ04 TaxID=2559236 RepID=UPI00107E9518|nr:hypothetical protein [Streptomyces sp. MZ04]TGB13301.1 hypothetical protein E2651_09820 [Streptomyces sp. MZ04]
MAKNAISKTVANSRARLAAEKRWNPNSDTTGIRRELKAALVADRLYKVVEDLAEENPYEEWADAVCASLPTMSAQQIAAAAHVFSCIDNRSEAGA